MTRTQVVSRFSWETVDPVVIRAMLVAAYRHDGNSTQAKNARKLSDEAARVTARKRFGEPPKVVVFSDAVLEVLRDRWLENAPAAVVDGLTAMVKKTLSAAAQAQDVSTKKAQVRFLRERNWTTNYRTNLRKAFLKAHKVRREVPRKPTGRSGPLGRPVPLCGRAGPCPNEWYEHQMRAWSELDRLWSNGTPFRGRIVFPTGGGKTATVVQWLLGRLQEDPDLRVLWIVHQQELVQQAMNEFERLACHQPASFIRHGRVVHSDASAPTTLADPAVDVAAVTFQSLRSPSPMMKKRLQAFFQRRTIVVVDEAHHAGAPSFDRLLDHLEGIGDIPALIGLTATPYPSGSEAYRKFSDRFPELIAETSATELIRGRILASPVVTTVETAERLDLSRTELAAASWNDLPAPVLQRLNSEQRNRIIVSTWLARKARWGKTLVFATNIEHADTLAELLAAGGASAKALHSESGDRAATLSWFRTTDDAVLVSVGMLTEGVDLPDARTAFLARPTTSPILMRQMVGRVLRGPRAGGDPEAHIVHFRDNWTNLPDVLHPAEVVPASIAEPRGSERTGEGLGDVIGDEEIAATEQLRAQIERLYEDAARRVVPDGGRAPDPLVDGARIAGFYEIRDVRAVVFEHQVAGYRALLRDALRREGMKRKGFLAYFDDTPPPFPSARLLRDLVEITRVHGRAPDLVPHTMALGPASVAVSIREAGPLDEAARFEMIAAEYRRSLNRGVYRTVEHFEEAVLRELRSFRRGPALHAETPVRIVDATSELPRLDRFRRDLGPSVELARSTAWDILPLRFHDRLDALPPVEWTRWVVTSTWGHWSMKLTGKGKGVTTIRINRLLRTKPKHVPDDMLAYLIFHEILHDLLPGQGHDAEFRELEALWPSATTWDLAFDTFHEKWDVRPETYNDRTRRPQPTRTAARSSLP